MKAPENLLSQTPLFFGTLGVEQDSLKQDYHTTIFPLIPALFPLELTAKQN